LLFGTWVGEGWRARYIEDAYEWNTANAVAEAERVTDWEMVLKARDSRCSHGCCGCSYATAVQEIFERNAATLSPQRLAAALRNVIQNGPSKTCRVPFLVGPSNTGKSTLLYPFDELYGAVNVVHKPALGSTFGLRNVVKKQKRLIFWDDYCPVQCPTSKKQSGLSR
jgi:hypothetical protein